MATTTKTAVSRTFLATAAAIPAYSLVQLDSAGKISVAGDNATDALIGVTIADVEASGYGTVQFLQCAGTLEVLTGSDAIAVGDQVYTDGDGKIGTDATNHPCGFALEASSVDGDVIEIVAMQQHLT
jgi:hypothetical protein